MSADFVCGWLSGCTASLAGQPFDTIRVRIQSGAALGSPLAVARQLHATEGLAGFLRGFAPPLLATGPRNAIGFAVQGEVARRCAERLNRRTSASDTELVRLASACAGGVCAGLAQCAVIVPADRIKVQQQVLSRLSDSAPEPMFEVANRLVRTHGVVGGLLTGGTATAMRQAPSAAIYFGFYHAVQPKLRDRFGLGGLSAPLLAGGFAGVFAYACTYPLDVIKARQQASGGRADTLLGMGSCNARHSSTQPVQHREVSELRTRASDLSALRVSSLSATPNSRRIQPEACAASPYRADASIRLPTMWAETQRAHNTHEALTVLETIRALNREVGPAWLVRGMGPTLLRAFVINAVNFACFESLKDRIKRMHR